MFREFSVTLAIAIGVSLIVSLTTTPMMCAKFLQTSTTASMAGCIASTKGVSISFMTGYASSLAVVLRHPQITLLRCSCTIGLNVYLFVIVPKGFFPQQDTGRMMGWVQASQDISFQAMDQKMHQYAISLRRIRPSNQ